MISSQVLTCLLILQMRLLFFIMTRTRAALTAAMQSRVGIKWPQSLQSGSLRHACGKWLHCLQPAGCMNQQR